MSSNILLLRSILVPLVLLAPSDFRVEIVKHTASWAGLQKTAVRRHAIKNDLVSRTHNVLDLEWIFCRIDKWLPDWERAKPDERRAGDFNGL